MIDKDVNETKQISRFEKSIKRMKNISIIIICGVIIVGSIGVYIASICTDSATIDTLNGFTGIVLGIVALTTSIVSMIVSFYSIEKSDESSRELNILLQEIKHHQSNTEKAVSNIDKNQQELSQMMSMSSTRSCTKDVDNQAWIEVKNHESK